MFRYICLPKLVAFYLREFSYREDGTTSTLYKFVFCLCLPFVSQLFRRARLIALAIAECTNSQDQITRVLKKITGADMRVSPLHRTYWMSYDGTGMSPEIPYDVLSKPLIPYEPVANAGNIEITLNGASQDEVSAYLELLIPFYIQANIIYK